MTFPWLPVMHLSLSLSHEKVPLSPYSESNISECAELLSARCLCCIIFKPWKSLKVYESCTRPCSQQDSRRPSQFFTHKHATLGNILLLYWSEPHIKSLFIGCPEKPASDVFTWLEFAEAKSYSCSFFNRTGVKLVFHYHLIPCFTYTLNVRQRIETESDTMVILVKI